MRIVVRYTLGTSCLSFMGHISFTFSHSRVLRKPNLTQSFIILLTSSSSSFFFPGEPNCRETKYDAVATFGCSHSVKDGRAASDVDAGVEAPFFAIPVVSPDISFLCFTDVEWFMIRLFSSGEYLC